MSKKEQFSTFHLSFSIPKVWKSRLRYFLPKAKLISERWKVENLRFWRFFASFCSDKRRGKNWKVRAAKL